MASPGGETVLVVDDDPMVLKVAARMLEALGYVVMRAALPSEAFRIAEQTRFDILLTDVMMPEMNGPDLAKALAAQHAPFRLVFMSGYGPSIVALDGTAAFLEKPFTRSQLAFKVGETRTVPQSGAA